MRIKMLKDAPGSPDGVTINEYSEGEAYNIADELGAVFVNFGYAVEIDHDDPAKAARPVREPREVDTSKPPGGKRPAGPSENK